mgnify:CR=1 FL=1
MYQDASIRTCLKCYFWDAEIVMLFIMMVMSICARGTSAVVLLKGFCWLVNSMARPGCLAASIYPYHKDSCTATEYLCES